jgi:hypothetical protein
MLKTTRVTRGGSLSVMQTFVDYELAFVRYVQAPPGGSFFPQS